MTAPAPVRSLTRVHHLTTERRGVALALCRKKGRPGAYVRFDGDSDDEWVPVGELAVLRRNR